jgi:serine/threonine-protein kinase
MNSNVPQQAQDDDATRIAPKKKFSPARSSKEHDVFSKNYKIEGIIGEGGVGKVYLAYDRTIGRRVAIKQIIDYSSQTERKLINSFVFEAKITGKLEHPSIIPIYKIGNHQHFGPYYVMKYIKGITLEEQFRFFAESENKNSFKYRMKLLDTLIDVCKAVAYAHSKGVIHRDIKPNNIISGKFGETVIIDWGLAQVIDDDNTHFFNQVKKAQQRTYSDLSSTSTMGTPRYMAPEQMSGQPTKASDVYSLGIILFRIITGRLPYSGSVDEIEKQLTSTDPTPSPSQFSTSAPPELVAICEQAIAKSTLNRFTDANELLNHLNDYRNGRLINIYNYSKKELLYRFYSRNKLLVYTFGLLLLSIITGAGYAIHDNYQIKLEKHKVEQALVTITTFLEKAQNEAHSIANEIRTSARTLYSDLESVGNQISLLKQSDKIKEKHLFSSLEKEYPKIESFSIRSAKSISSESLLGWKTNVQKYDAPIIEVKNGRLQIIFRSPITINGHVEQFLEAQMYPEKVIPALFPIAPISSTASRDIWIIRNDGQIIFDEDSKYIGKNLFTDIKIEQTSSLSSFAKLAFNQDEGIGHYTFIDDNKEVQKVASWNSIKFNESERWVIIVTYPYLVRKTKR